MVESMQALLPNAAVHQIGMFKRSGSDRPVEYYSRLPKHGGDPVISPLFSIPSWPRRGP